MRREVEHGLQVAVARYLDLCLDPALTWWSAIDHGAGKMSGRAAGMMKARGVKRGLPDIVILWRKAVGRSTYPFMLGIELKSESGRLSAAQEQASADWAVIGYSICVARSVEEVQASLERNQAPLRHKMVMFGGRG